jgi:hypothetical protein
LDFEGMRNPNGQSFAAFGKVVKGIEYRQDNATPK